MVVQGLVSGDSHGPQRELSAVGAGTLAVAGSVAAEAASTVPGSNVLCCVVDKIDDCSLLAWRHILTSYARVDRIHVRCKFHNAGSWGEGEDGVEGGLARDHRIPWTPSRLAQGVLRPSTPKLDWAAFGWDCLARRGSDF